MSKYLNKEEQIDYYEKMMNGDEEARNELILSCVPLAYRIAQKFSNNNKHIGYHDLAHIGLLAFTESIEKFNPHKGRLTTFAHRCMTNAIIDAINGNKYQINTYCDMPIFARRAVAKIKKCETKNISKIAEQTGLSESRIKELLPFIDNRRTSLASCRQAIRPSETTNGCIADILNLLDKIGVSTNERNVFEVWLQHVNSTDRVKKTARHFNITNSQVIDTVNSIKERLKNEVQSQGS